jgi:hypothetical protein
MKHEGNPLGLTVIYVDMEIDTELAQAILIRHFNLVGEDVAWWA